MAGTWTAEAHREVQRLRAAGKTWGQVAAAMGRSMESCRNQFRNPREIAPTPEESMKLTETGNGTAELSMVTAKQIKTLDDALEAGNVDLKIWRVKEWTLNKWDMGYVKKTGDAATQQLWQVKIRLERIVKKWLSDAADQLFLSLRKLPVPTQQKASKAGRMLEVSLFDVHLGKYAWAKETGTNQDTRLQSIVYANAVSDLLNQAKGTYEKIVFPVGSDFFQANNWLGETEAGTRVDHDGRMTNVFLVGVNSVAAAINACAKIAPVEVLYVPGNHDPATSFHLCVALMNRFWNSKHITVDCGPTPRKYVRFGCNLLGFTHGNEERFDSLPTIMAQDRRKDWSQTTHREWHVGHQHRKRQYMTKDADEVTGVRIKVLPSLSGTDAWHNKKGFVHALRSAEAHVWDRRDGYVGHWSVNARG